MFRVEMIEAYSNRELVAMIHDFQADQPRYTLKAVTVGPDNSPHHNKLGSEIYTAWLER